jgi:dihydrofolate synthase/folylpolyglutamate synthase
VPASAYQQTLDYLYSQLPMFQRIGAPALKKDLSNTLALMAHLGQPHHRFPSIHIAGTNGKGSAAHMLAAIAQASGRKTGLYVSPHYRDFRERIKVDGRYIDKAYVVEFVARHSAFIEALRPSFFEITVALAFDYFAAQEVDLAVVETGLGGRLDSTNVVTPLLSLITNISFDHQQFLGDTLPLIAAEKAGIIKASVPAVVGESHPETRPVFENRAREMGAPLYFADEHFRAVLRDEDFSHGLYDVYQDGDLRYPSLRLDASGPFQARNLIAVLQAAAALDDGEMRFAETAIRAGLAELRRLTCFMGRWQAIGERPLILCDSAHNEAGIAMAMERLAAIPRRQAHLVIGALNDKDISKMLALMPSAARYYFARPGIPRGLDAEALRAQAAPLGLYGRAYASVRHALRAARRAAAPDDLIYVGGSTFVVAEVLPRPAC